MISQLLAQYLNWYVKPPVLEIQVVVFAYDEAGPPTRPTDRATLFKTKTIKPRRYFKTLSVVASVYKPH